MRCPAPSAIEAGTPEVSCRRHALLGDPDAEGDEEDETEKTKGKRTKSGSSTSRKRAKADTPPPEPQTPNPDDEDELEALLYGTTKAETVQTEAVHAEKKREGLAGVIPGLKVAGYDFKVKDS